MRKLTTYVMKEGKEAALFCEPECAISPVEE